MTLADIHIPIFAVGTERDHVAPWRSVYKINWQAQAEITFLLTNGGHNAGIISEPGHAERGFRMHCKDVGGHYFDPERFLTEAERTDGSWWPQWLSWLADRSGAFTAPPGIGTASAGYPPLDKAPGTYVLQQ